MVDIYGYNLYESRIICWTIKFPLCNRLICPPIIYEY